MIAPCSSFQILRRAVLFVICLFLPLQGLTAQYEAPERPPGAGAAARETPAAPDLLPGVALAQGLTEITGVAISPLLGVSSVGAWRYFHTAEAARAELPWYCHPWFWGTGFFILGLCFCKDLVGTAVPALLKKPFDMAELFEDKLSALVASSAFVPLIALETARHFKPPADATSAHLADLHFAAMLPGPALGSGMGILFVVLGVLAFLVVWLAFHAINVLIAISPFGVVDTALKLFKTSLLSSILLAYLLSPILGAMVALVFIGLAAWIAPFAFRFTLFGTLVATDILMPWRQGARPDPRRSHAFAVDRSLGIPVRTYGRISRAPQGGLEFSYRPWLVLPERRIGIPVERPALGAGTLYPSILCKGSPGSPTRRVLLFLPRYRGREDSLAVSLAIDEIEHSPISKGIRAVRQWLAETLANTRRRA
jgi:hypothetical protein